MSDIDSQKYQECFKRRATVHGNLCSRENCKEETPSSSTPPTGRLVEEIKIMWEDEVGMSVGCLMMTADGEIGEMWREEDFQRGCQSPKEKKRLDTTSRGDLGLNPKC
ncbi:hypothetical protein TNCV_3829111 [Trichonephila clavipes]|nr:hypothetical protein TNCV_3829111 [Trichonephila clavipes]